MPNISQKLSTKNADLLVAPYSFCSGRAPKECGGAVVGHMNLNEHIPRYLKNTVCLGGGFKYFLFSPLFGEDSNFD